MARKLVYDAHIGADVTSQQWRDLHAVLQRDSKTVSMWIREKIEEEVRRHLPQNGEDDAAWPIRS
jgi:hypothetical protein